MTVDEISYPYVLFMLCSVSWNGGKKALLSPPFHETAPAFRLTSTDMQQWLRRLLIVTSSSFYGFVDPSLVVVLPSCYIPATAALGCPPPSNCSIAGSGGNNWKIGG